MDCAHEAVVLCQQPVGLGICDLWKQKFFVHLQQITNTHQDKYFNKDL